MDLSELAGWGVLFFIIMLVLCLVFIAIIFAVARALIRRGKRTARRLTPDTLQRTVLRGMEKLDQRFPNDPREAARWQSGSSTSGQAIADFDLDAYEEPSRPSARTEAPILSCSACGALMKPGSKACDYCGYQAE